MKKRTQASFEVTARLVQLGFPRDFAEIIGQELNTDFTAAWMLRYLDAAHPTTMTDIADEMLEILSFRDQWVERHCL